MYQIGGVSTMHSIFNFLTCFVLTDLPLSCVFGVYWVFVVSVKLFK